MRRKADLWSVCRSVNQEGCDGGGRYRWECSMMADRSAEVKAGERGDQQKLEWPGPRVDAARPTRSSEAARGGCGEAGRSGRG